MYQVKCGATTTWERWDALKPDGTVNEEKMAGSGENMVSFNHYAFGSVGSFTINISWESDRKNRALQNCILHLIRTSAWEAYPGAIFRGREDRERMAVRTGRLPYPACNAGGGGSASSGWKK